MTWEEIKSDIQKNFGKKIKKWAEHNSRRIYIDIDNEDIEEFTRYIFKELKGRFIIASGVDTPYGVIEILYHFDFFQLPQVLSLRIKTEKPDPEVASIAAIIKGAEWIEREIAELLGVNFKGHPDMKHLLLPDDWPEGSYPLRRDK
ncbi:NADH-quinone oxidoreductase subunit C [bacterium]|nr:NADH-quinone oxidoreductase subunit C [bacterium]